jgi:zinc D-Ala-D-Ala carboxypeptidase
MTTALGMHATPPIWTPDEQKRWPHFTPTELACKCPREFPHFCKGEYFHDPEWLDAIERYRAIIGGPVRFNSAHRCKKRNKHINGASRSQHLQMAGDIPIGAQDRAVMARAALEAGFRGIGFGRTFLHVDMGPKRAWNYRSDAKALWVTAFGFDPVARFKKTGEL